MMIFIWVSIGILLIWWLVLFIQFIRENEIMLRTICPFCNKEVFNRDKEGYVINGRGLFKTKTLYHLKCYDDFVTHKMNSALFREVLNENQ